MAQQDQGNHTGKSQKLKRLPLTHWIIFIVILLLIAISTLILIIYNHNTWSSVLPFAIFAELSVVVALLQWLFPISSHTAEQTTATLSELPTSQIATYFPSTVLQPQQSLLEKKPTFRKIVGLPPPTDPRAIQQRETIVKRVYTELISQNTSAVVLTGIAGVGKSTLAALVYRYAEEQRRIGNGPFTIGAIWLNIDPAVNIDDLMGTLFENLSKPLPDVSNLDPRLQAAVLFKELNETDKFQLVILDQFENLLDWHTGEASRPGVGEWLDVINSNPSSSRILLTSRPWPRGTYHYAPTYMQEYYVEGLEPAEGIELLRKQGVEEKQATEKDLYEVVAYCDGHAQALTLLASILRHNQSLSLTTFLNDPIYSQYWTGDIARNLLDYIWTQQMSELERKLLLTFSVYREPVTMEAAHALVNFDTEVPKMQILDALHVLLTQHLLQALGEERYQLHAIVAFYAKEHFDETSELANQQVLRAVHARAAQYYQEQASINYPPREKRQQSSDIHPLIEAIWQLCQSGQWREAYELMQHERIFVDLNGWGENATLLELYLLLLPLNKWKPERLNELNIYNDLGLVYADLGQNKEAKECLEQALSICREVEDKERESIILNRLGMVYADLGMKEEARENLEQALNIDKEFGDYKREGITLNNLGLIYWVQGKKEQALEHYQAALNLHREVGNREGEGTALNAIGLLYNSLGHKKQAREYYKQALKIRREIKDRKGEAITLRNLGVIYFDQIHYDVALAALLVARFIFEEIQSPIREFTQSVIDTLHEKLGDEQFTILFAQVESKASQIVEQALGEE